MQYNIHPLFVHFPIALLFVYSIIKILPFDRWFPSVTWKHIERVFLLVGVLGAFAALGTGDSAEHLSQANSQLIEVHATFGGLATFLYGALLAGEFFAVVNPIAIPKIKNSTLTKTMLFLEKVLCNKIFAKVIAFLALIAICVTGLLGGTIVYGVSADPFAGFVLNILGIKL